MSVVVSVYRKDDGALTHENFAKELEAARAEIQRLLDLIKKLQAQITDLEGQLVEKDDTIRHLQYKLDLCPYKCKKITAPAPAPPPPEPEPEEDPTSRNPQKSALEGFYLGTILRH